MKDDIETMMLQTFHVNMHTDTQSWIENVAEQYLRRTITPQSSAHIYSIDYLAESIMREIGLSCGTMEDRM